MRRIVAGLALALVLAAPASAAGSITVNEPGPYQWGDTITLTVEVPKLKGYEYPVVLVRCYGDPDIYPEWVHFRRWDTEPGPIVLDWFAGSDQPGPQAIDCNVGLWAYPGLRPGKYEHQLAGIAIHVEP